MSDVAQRTVRGAEHLSDDVLGLTHNTAVGGSKSSQHLLGKAADIQVADTTVEAVAAYAESLMPDWGGVGRYPIKPGRAKGWVHVDTRPNKSRWTQ